MISVKEFGQICKLPQDMLKIYLECILKGFGYEVINEDGYLYAKGTLPYCVTAHMDTVHKKTCKKYLVKSSNGQTVVWSKDGIGGDDRCGVAMIIELLKRNYRPTVLFCEDEEIGGVGSDKFVLSKYIDDLNNMNYLIELDRANADDAVFYSCDNEEFTQFITETTGYKEAHGSFSDISTLAPNCKVAAVNLSCGYYNAHTTKEYVVMEEMNNTVDVVEKLFNVKDCKQFEYIEKKYGYDLSSYYYGSYGYGYRYADEFNGLEVAYVDGNGKENVTVVYGTNETEALLEFFFENPDIPYGQILDYTEF